MAALWRHTMPPAALLAAWRHGGIVWRHRRHSGGIIGGIGGMVAALLAALWRHGGIGGIGGIVAALPTLSGGGAAKNLWEMQRFRKDAVGAMLRLHSGSP